MKRIQIDTVPGDSIDKRLSIEESESGTGLFHFVIINNSHSHPHPPDSILSLLLVGTTPNPQLARYLELSLSSGALPVCQFIKTVHEKVKAEPLPFYNCLVSCLSSHTATIRTRYLGHVTDYQPISDQYFLIRSVPGRSANRFGPLGTATKWQNLSVTADQNIQIPCDACSDTGKKTLAGCVISLVRSLESIGGSSEKQTLRHHVFNLPCRQLLYQDILQQGRICTTEFINKIAFHYRCSVEQVCLELGKSHLTLMASDSACREPILALLLYKYPTLLSDTLPSSKSCRDVVTQLIQEEPLWNKVASSGGADWNISLPFLQAVLTHKIITTDVFESLKTSLPTEGTGICGVFDRASQLLTETIELFTRYTGEAQFIAGIEGVSRGHKNFCELADRMFYVALARGQLNTLMSGVSDVIDSVSEATTDEQSRSAVFDISCLLLVRCTMIFGAQVVPQSAVFGRWLGSHSCGMYSPTLPILPLTRPVVAESHQRNVDCLVQFLSSTSERNVDTSSFKNLIIAFPDALRDTMQAIKTKVILDETFKEQTSKFRDLLLVPVFVAIHWLIHFSETVEEDLRHVSKLMMKPFLKNVTQYTSTILLQQRCDLLQKGLHATLSLHDKKKLVKKSFWTSTVGPERGVVETDKAWKPLSSHGNHHSLSRRAPTLDCLSELGLFDNVSNVVSGEALQVLSFPINDDITHGVVNGPLYHRLWPRRPYVPWLFENTIPGLLIDGLAPKYKSYGWQLSKLAFISIDLYLTGVNTAGGDQDNARVKRVCGSGTTDDVRWEMLREPLAVFWRNMTTLLQKECEELGITFIYQFFNRFIKCALETDRDRLKELISGIDRDSLRDGAAFMVRNGSVKEGLALLELSGSALDEQSAVLQTVLRRQTPV
eukprot:sb/3479383/